MNEFDLMQLLNEQKIQYRRYDHAAVYTCEQSARLLPEIGGVGTKNLFLSDEKEVNFFLVVFSEEKRLDIKTLEKNLGVKGLHFATPQNMQKLLKLDPGSVTLFGILNDENRAVQLLIDCDLWGEEIHSHPLVNTATLVMPTNEIQKVMDFYSRTYLLIEIPEKN